MAGPLVAQSSSTGSTAFAQQGTLDWTALSRSSFTFSVEVMSRFSKAGVEMITCAMGQAMCSQFNVPPEGQKRVTDAISKLKAYSSYGQVLWFGFGVKHIVRSLCETKQGATSAALCACLRVSYSTEMSARVLSVLCDQLLPSDGLSPALPQWAALLDVCSGALGPSKFPVMVDGFCRLAFTDRQPHSHNATTVNALAHALAELLKVSNGSVSTITFEGGYDCAWIAAVAEWLLCLKVKVVTEEGSCVYWQDSSHTSSSAQVTIIFNAHTHDAEPAGTKELKVVNRSFRLPCNERFKLISHSVGGWEEPFGMGRSRWSTILEDTFGSAFKMLLSPNIVGLFAKILLSDAMGHDSGDYGSCNGWRAIHPWMGPISSPAASRERAFFLAIASRLPELSPLLDALEYLGKASGAAAGLEGSQLWNICGCKSCRQRRGDRTARKPRGICLHYLGMTLMNLIGLLARIDVDENIQPASTGLLLLYNYIIINYSVSHESPILFTNIWWDRGLRTIYRRTFELFTGLPSHKNWEENWEDVGAASSSAMCHGGICIWLPALENPLYDPSKQIRLRVVLGNVSFRDRLYREIVDIGMSEVPYISKSVVPAVAAHGTSRVSTLVVRETLDASRLEAWIELRSGKTSSAFNAYLEHLGIERLGRLPSELRIHIRKLYGSLHKKIDHRTCEVRLGPVRSQRLPKPDLSTWERPCPSLAILLESTTPPKRSYNYPEAGEWILVMAGTKAGVATVELVRGNFTLLYYLMSHEHDAGLKASLSIFDGCIRCLAYELSEKVVAQEGMLYVNCNINIHTIMDTRSVQWSAKLTGTLSVRQACSHSGDN